MKKIKHALLLILMSSFLSMTATAQLTVTGKVTDATTNEGLPGVSIVLLQKTGKSLIGTTSDIRGNFKLDIAESTGKLQFSFVGFRNQEVEVSSANAASVEIKLAEDIAKLDEVVVSGLATSVKRSNLANSVSTVSARELTGVTNPQTIDGALQGKVAGANIISSTGAPGGGMSVRFRGVTSIYGRHEPLYVVDGVYMDNNSIAGGLNVVTAAAVGGNASNQDNPSNRIADLNPDEIENIEILKGASAAAIYGSQAAAGVVVITTKKGKSTGRTNVNFSQDIGVASARKLLGVRQLDATKVEDTYGAGAVPDFESAQAAGKIYDYEKEVYGEKGILLNSRLSFTGGNDRTSFFISGGLKKENGIVEHTGYINRSIRANVDHRFSDRTVISFSTNFINSSADRGLTNNDNNSVTYGISLAFTPSFMELHPGADGVYPENNFAPSNVLQTRDLIKNNETTYRTLNNISIKSYLMQKEKSNLRLILSGGFDFYNLKTFAYFPRTLQFESGGSGTNGASIQGNSNNLNLNTSAFLVHYCAPSDKLNFTSSIGETYESGDLNTVLNTATELIGLQTNLDQSGAISVEQIRQKYRNNGYFAQEEVNFNDQLIVTAGIRFDKSTTAADIKKFYTYPKASLAWNVSKMGFWSVNSVDNLKLRVAYGQSGNFPVYGSKFTSLVPVTLGQPGSLVNILKGNPEITPERQTELEGGADVGFAKNRINLSATYYNKKCFDLLLQRNVPQSSGFTTEWVNGAELTNKGYEISLGLVPVQKENIRWNLNISYWKNKSEITKLDVDPFTLGAFGNSLGNYKIEEGKPATQIVGLTGDTLANGELVLDENGNPLVGQLGDAEPDFQMSFSNEITFLKNFSLGVLVHWKKGGDVINLTELLTDLGGTSPDFDVDENGNGVADGLDRINDLGVTAKGFVQEASYVRIREIGLYYNFPLSQDSKVLKGLKVGVSANNYFTWTDYKSYDPEVSNFGSNDFSTGVEVLPYPSSKRIFFHLSANF